MASGRVVVPWEHWVCTRCLEDNQYALWLIKLKCFKPRHRQHYYPGRKTLVSIDPSAMRLVKMRPPPVNIEMSSVPIQLCQSYPHCQYRDNCPRPHSQVEYETWEFIRTLFKGWWWDIKPCMTILPFDILGISCVSGAYVPPEHAPVCIHRVLLHLQLLLLYVTLTK